MKSNELSNKLKGKTKNDQHCKCTYRVRIYAIIIRNGKINKQSTGRCKIPNENTSQTILEIQVNRDQAGQKTINKPHLRHVTLEHIRQLVCSSVIQIL